MVQALIGKKIGQTQRFLENGTRIPVTEIAMPSLPVVMVKTQEKDGYTAAQLGFGSKKKATKALLGHSKGAKLEKAPQFLREVRLSGEDMPEVGSMIAATDIFKPGDIVDVAGVSKGKGYAGGVKRYHFKGGPRTHGQSDRERAPGSIGQTTTPGRVYKGKRMAGNMGKDHVTVRNVEIVDVLADMLLIKGLVPGGRNTIITVTKVGEKKNFVPLLKDTVEEEVVESAVDEVATVAPTEETIEKVEAAKAEAPQAEEPKKAETIETKAEASDPVEKGDEAENKKTEEEVKEK